jgi:hypothetical protein
VVEPFFEELAQGDEVKQVGALVEIDQDVDVTFLPLFASDHRTEYADFMDLERAASSGLARCRGVKGSSLAVPLSDRSSGYTILHSRVG